MNKIGLILLSLHLLWASETFAQTFQATVNRNEVPQGETFLLTLETDDAQNKATPDLSVLNKDFDVYSVGNAYQSTYVNGVSKHSRQWQIILMPKNSGKIEIPSITLGSMKSEPIYLNVAPAQFSQQANARGGQQTAQKPKFAVDAEVNNTNPYVQQQINYAFKIYDSGGLYGETPVLAQDNNDWIIKSIGEPVISSKIINGQQLREIEFNYALFPQKSGLLKTPDFEFNGYYLTRSHRGATAFDDIFNHGFFNMGFSDMFASRNPVRLQPEPIEINVKAIPAANGGYWWLPASEVTLSSEWDDKTQEFYVGEAISRSIYIKAGGVVDAQLPDIKFAEIDGVKQYPDKPITMSSQENGNIISVKKFSNVYIPERSGNITLPGVSIDWFNVHTGQLEKAILPPQTINVLPAKNGNSDETLTQQSELSAPQNIANQETTELPVASKVQRYVPVWIWTILAFIIGLLSSWIVFSFVAKKEINKTTNYTKKIREAIQSGNNKALRDNIIAWAQDNYPENKIHNIEDIISSAENKLFKEQLAELNSLLYSSKKANFNPEIFIKAFAEEQKKRKKKQKSFEHLPNLYKK